MSARRSSPVNGRDALVAAAAQALVEGDRRSVTYRSVAERAGVSYGLVRYYFADLDALIREAIPLSMENFNPATIEPGTGDVSDFAVGLVQEVRERRSEYIMLLELATEASRADGTDGAPVRRMYESFFASIDRELARMGLDHADDTLARVVLAALDGLILQQLVFRDEAAMERGLEQLRSLIRLSTSERAASDALDSGMHA